MNVRLLLPALTSLILCVTCRLASADEGTGPVARIAWEDNMLTLVTPNVPGGEVKIWYLEAFCRSGSTDRDWRETVIPHETTQVEVDESGQRIRLESVVAPGVHVRHTLTVVEDGVAFDVIIENQTDGAVDIDWAQPCMRVGDFTGREQEDYHERCFIFTDSGKTMLHETERTVQARYLGGQVYVPAGINLDDVNPRPISPEKPVNHVIGAESVDGKWVLAMAWDDTQELFQGVIVCIHADFRVGGLEAGETKRLKGRVYLMPNDTERLLEAYRRDFKK